ncbi:MAG: excisionase family DNA-binding protein [Armatimonadetes bacterium]|nr:excisionase family DNA-binding protein [Akkermansiaceae bacterium]
MSTELGTLQQQSGSLIGDRLVKKSVAAVKLGISLRTVDRLIQKGVLEKVFVGSSPRLRLSQLDRLVERGS